MLFSNVLVLRTSCIVYTVRAWVLFSLVLVIEMSFSYVGHGCSFRWCSVELHVVLAPCAAERCSNRCVHHILSDRGAVSLANGCVPWKGVPLCAHFVIVQTH